jgi:hypothetical protein
MFFQWKELRVWSMCQNLSSGRTLGPWRINYIEKNPGTKVMFFQWKGLRVRTSQGICGNLWGKVWRTPKRAVDIPLCNYFSMPGPDMEIWTFQLLDVRVLEFKTHGNILYRIPRLLKRWMIVNTKLLGHLDSWTGFILGSVGSHDLQEGWISRNPGLAWLVNKLSIVFRIQFILRTQTWYPDPLDCCSYGTSLNSPPVCRMSRLTAWIPRLMVMDLYIGS